MAGDKIRKTPERRCIGCGDKIEKRGLMRIVRDKEMNVSIDPTGKMNGRGAYLCKDSSCLEKAIKRKALERALKCEISEEIYEKLRSEFSESEC